MFYSTGIINAINCTGNTKNSQIGIIKGSSSLFLNNNDFKKNNDIIFANKTLRNLQIFDNYDSDFDVAVKIEDDEEINPPNFVPFNVNQMMLKQNFAMFAMCFSDPILSNYKSGGYNYDITRFERCEVHLDNSIFENYKFCMMYHQYNNRLCKANLPQYLRNIEGIKDVRNLASYELQVVF